MTKLCIDFGSGYNPKTGYKTCDITTFPQLDFQYDGKDEIVGLREKSVDVFYLRNVVHHIPNLQRTFITLKKYLKVGGKLVIIDSIILAEHSQNHFAKVSSAKRQKMISQINII